MRTISVKVTKPTSFSPSKMGSFLMFWSNISFAASRQSVSSSPTIRGLDIISETLVSSGFLPGQTIFFKTSLSVIIPTGFSFLVTTRQPIPFLFISSTASLIFVAGLTVITSLTIMSLARATSIVSTYKCSSCFSPFKQYEIQVNILRKQNAQMLIP